MPCEPGSGLAAIRQICRRSLASTDLSYQFRRHQNEIPARATQTRRNTAERRIQLRPRFGIGRRSGSLIEDGYAGFSASRVVVRAPVSRAQSTIIQKIDLIGAATAPWMKRCGMPSPRQRCAPSDRSKFLDPNTSFAPTYRALSEIMIAAH
jgi:hypothetical protein